MKFTYDDIIFYSKPYPKIGEILICTPYEIDKDLNIIKFMINQYKKKAIMTFNKATRKKKNPNWNIICPLNKKTNAIVESISENSIELSFIDINKDNENYINFLKNEKDNYTIYSLIKAISKINNIDINELWINLIYPLDKLRLEQEELELIDIVKSNIDKIINSKYDFNEKTINKIKSFFVKKDKKKEKLKTNFNIVALNDINIIKNIFKRLLTKYENKINIYRDNGPFYYIKSNHNDISKKDHLELLELIKENFEKESNILFKN